MKKSRKKTAVIIIALALTVFSGFFIPGLMQKNGMDGYKNTGAKSTESPGVPEDGIVTAYPGEGQSPDIGGADKGEPVTIGAEPAGKTPEIEPEGEKTPDKEIPGKQAQTPGPGASASGTPTPSQGDISDKPGGGEVPGVGGSGQGGKAGDGDWVDEKIDRHRDEVEEEDIAELRRILGKLDMGKVAAYFEDGLTEEENSQLYKYIDSKLTEGEYEAAKNLFLKYDWLLDEE